MAKIEDISAADVRLAAVLRRLKEASILNQDKQDLEDFYYFLRRANLKKDSQLNYINCLKKACEYYLIIGVDKPLRQIELRDFDKLIFYLEDDLKRRDWTINQYKKSLRKFLTWVHGTNIPAWVTSEIKTKKVATRVTPESLPTPSEFADFLEAASCSRDTAIIAVYADAGIRLSALMSCLVSSFVETQHAAILYLNPEGPLKTTAAKGIPLTWSTGYVQKWLADHPLRGDPNAPLWTTRSRQKENPKDKDSPLIYGALSSNAAYKIFLSIEKRTGTKKHIHPHLLRHYAVTNWIKDGLPEQIIKHRAGWGPDSREMGRYGNWTEEELNDRVFEIYNLKTDKKRTVELKTCPRCNNILKPEDRFCARCALVLDHNTALESDKAAVLASDIAQSLPEDELFRLFQKYLNSQYVTKK